MATYFTASGYAVTSGGIVYASDLNNPLSALETSFDNLVGDIRTGSGLTTVADTGSANTYVMTLDPAITSYSEGLEVWLKPANTNTGASTLNINGLGVKDIRRFGLQELEAGDLSANYYTHLKYDGTCFQVVSIAGSSAAAAATSASEALASAAAASTSAANASTSETNAATSAASINLPTISGGDANKVLRVNAAEDGYDLEDEFASELEAETGTESAKAIAPDTLAAVIVDKQLLGMSEFIHVQHQLASGTDGGGASAGMNDITLNAEETNTLSGASLASNEVTLPAGTYYAEANAAFWKVDEARVFITLDDDTILLRGVGVDATDIGAALTVSGVFTLATEDDVKLRAYCGSTRADDGLGQSIADGGVEVFADLKIWRVA